uniref:Amine oxidase n=1 Tax=Odontella aurita TaxID=265563 RepID=A0A7S4J987_9STRA
MAVSSFDSWAVPFGGCPLLSLALAAAAASVDAQPACSARDYLGRPDPSLREIEFDIGYGPEVFDAYVQPDVSTFYGEEEGTRKAAVTSYNGLAGKFVNMSPEPLTLYWDPGNGQGSRIGSCDPFEACGTATFPTHRFYFEHVDTGERVASFVVQAGKSAYYYDPYEVPTKDSLTLRNLQALSFDEYQKYERHARSRSFGEKYKDATGREYLAMYPRNKPTNFMWNADFIGQEHWATTRETHFVRLPPESSLDAIERIGKSRVLADDEVSFGEWKDSWTVLVWYSFSFGLVLANSRS